MDDCLRKKTFFFDQLLQRLELGKKKPNRNHGLVNYERVPWKMISVGNSKGKLHFPRAVSCHHHVWRQHMTFPSSPFLQKANNPLFSSYKWKKSQHLMFLICIANCQLSLFGTTTRPLSVCCFLLRLLQNNSPLTHPLCFQCHPRPVTLAVCWSSGGLQKTACLVQVTTNPKQTTAIRGGKKQSRTPKLLQIVTLKHLGMLKCWKHCNKTCPSSRWKAKNRASPSILWSMHISWPAT